MLNVYEIAKKEIGQKEKRGVEHNPRILEYFKAVGSGWIQEDEVPWCGAFVGWCLIQAGYEVKINHPKGFRPISARSWENYGLDVVESRKGSIIVLYDTQRKDNDTRSGYHVGFFDKVTFQAVHGLPEIALKNSAEITLLGGNQNNEVCYKDFPLSRYKVIAEREPHEIF